MTGATILAISTIIAAIIGACTSVGISVGTEEYQKGLEKKADDKKATYTDLLTLLNKITISASSASITKKNQLYSKLNNIFSNSPISSGVVEAAFARVRHNLRNAHTQVEQLMNEGAAYESSAERQAAAYASYSARERAGSKNKDGSWNLNTSAGRAGSEAESLSNQAAEKYNEAKALGEKYV